MKKFISIALYGCAYTSVLAIIVYFTCTYYYFLPVFILLCIVFGSGFAIHTIIEERKKGQE